MRIALVGPFTGESLHSRFEIAPGVKLPAGYPGAPLMAVLARQLVDRGHQVATISTDYPTPVAELEPFKVHRAGPLTAYFCPQRPRSFRGNGTRRGRMLDFFKSEREWLGAAIDDFAPDVIHAHWTYEFAWAALDSGVPTLVTSHDSPLKVLRFTPNAYRFARYLMARRVLARCTHLTAVSPDLQRDLERLAPGPIDVVANPIPEAILQSPGCAPDAMSSRRLMMVLNGWTDLKNGANALQAFRRARQADATLRLDCFGSGFESDGAANRWAAERGLTEGVTFHGPTPYAQILETMRHSLALLHPSRWEACCMSIAEAMSLGLPVIGGRATDGVPWQLDDGRAGLLADVTDPADLARAIGALASDPQRWQAISAAARERARDLFAARRVVDRYLTLYAGVLASPTVAVPAAGVL